MHVFYINRKDILSSWLRFKKKLNLFTYVEYFKISHFFRYKQQHYFCQLSVNKQIKF